METCRCRVRDREEEIDVGKKEEGEKGERETMREGEFLYDIIFFLHRST